MFKLLTLLAVVLLAYYWQAHIIRGPVFTTDKNLNGKTVLITGGNEGIGKAAAIEFAKLGANVVIASRNLAKSESAKEHIIKESGNKNVHSMRLDLGDFENVRSFVKSFLQTHDHLDILVNNAGVAGVEGTSTSGYNMVSTINHFGTFLLTGLLMDKMKEESKRGPIRIINVSSEAHKLADSFRVDKFREDPSGFVDSFVMYGYTKLANIYFTSELKKRLEGFDISTYSLHPGSVRTELGQESNFISKWMKYALRSALGLFLRSPFYGAQTILYCALDDDVVKFNGDYFKDCHRSELADFAKDELAAKTLWEDSLKITGLRDY